MRRFLAIATLVLVTLTTACGGNPPLAICGTIGSVTQSVFYDTQLQGGDDSTGIHSISFTDGRLLRIHGIPSTDLEKGKAYLFPVSGPLRTNLNPESYYKLVGKVHEEKKGCNAPSATTDSAVVKKR